MPATPEAMIATASHFPGQPPTAADRPLKAANAVAVLRRLFARDGAAPLRIEVVRPQEMPQPQRALLVHRQDMTSTLERHYEQRISLQVARREFHRMHYFREVLLTLPDGQGVEYGVIKIDLEKFPAPAREQIMEEQIPLGRILADHELAYQCRPQTYYRFGPHPHILALLGGRAGARLYGRRNLLLSPESKLMADVVEILPPLAAATE